MNCYLTVLFADDGPYELTGKLANRSLIQQRPWDMKASLVI